MEPYESIYAGQFMFTLGYLCAARGLAPAGNCVTLLAQNPGDQVIGDVVASWGGLTSIIEFKRREGAVRTEFLKPAKKDLLDGLKDKRNARYLEVSHRGHFVAFGEVTGRTSADVHVLRYADIEDSRKQRAASLLMHEFLDRILGGQIGYSPTEFGRYAALLKELHDKAAGSQPTPNTMSSLVVNVDAATNRFTFVVVDLLRLRELKLDRELSRPDLELPPPTHGKRDIDLGR